MMKQEAEEIKAFSGRDSVFEGKMTFQGLFQLDGTFQGEISGDGTLILGETAIVRGKLGTRTIIVKGFVEGEVHAHGRVEIHSTGKVYGTLVSPKLKINEGGILEGQCEMERQPRNTEKM
jgi:cytoskeletal protein CcmA (bactofilin family)